LHAYIDGLAEGERRGEFTHVMFEEKGSIVLLFTAFWQQREWTSFRFAS